MERLTTRNSDGSVGISEFRYYNYDDFQKLASRLADYEDAEEQGLLLMLPCKIGDTVWFVDNDNDNYPIELCVTKIEVFEIYIFYRAVTTDDGTQAVFDCGDIGKTVFLTKEEAEQALKQMGE